jgi:3-oxoacyl-[acyl-carrier protein] reductase
LLVNRIRSHGGISVAHEADLSYPENIPLLFDRCETTLGPVDVLVNNHTHCALETFDPALVSDKDSGISLTTATSIDAHFAVNARAYALMMAEYFKRYLIRNAKSGKIINPAQTRPTPVANISYAPANITDRIAAGCSGDGQVRHNHNIVAPGLIQTGYITPDDEADIAFAHTASSRRSA